MIVEDIEIAAFGQVFGIIVTAATEWGTQLLKNDSGTDINRALFDVHELHEVPTFAAWWRDVVELAKERFGIEDRMRPTMDYLLCCSRRLFPEDAIRYVEGFEDDES